MGKFKKKTFASVLRIAAAVIEYNNAQCQRDCDLFIFALM